MHADNRTQIFMPIEEFERTLRDLTPTDARAARIAHLRAGIETYWSEVNWKSGCQPSFWLQCLFPPLWPILWYRGALSTATQRALGLAIHRCSRRWAHELREDDVSLDGIPDPPEWA